MTAPPALLPVPRPKITKSYDQRTVEQSFQSLERDLQQKFDRRGDLVLDPGAELVLTADGSSAQYGIGIDVSGYIRILNYADGSIGTFSVAWAQVDGAQQEITNLTTYVDAADSTLQANINTVATTSANNGAAISTLQTEITAAREGEASLLANITDVRTAFASADAAEASARTTLQANLEAADTTLQANIDAEESARVTADAAEAASRTALEASLTKAAVQLNVDNFNADGFYWTSDFGGAPESVADPSSVTYTDVSGVGRVLQTSTFPRYLTPKSVIRPYVGLKIRVEAKVRATVDPTSGSISVILGDVNGLDSGYVHGAASESGTAVSGYSNQESGLTVSDGWVTIAQIWEVPSLSTYDAGWRPRLDFTHTGSGGTVQVAYFKIEDVTEAQDIRASVTTEEVARIAADAAEATARQTLAATIGGTGVNLLPLEYTRFDGSIPTLSASSSLTLSYVADANISGPGGILVTEDGVDGSLFKYLVLADSLTDYNVRVTPGQTYIISAYFQSNISKQLGIRVRNGSDGSYTWVFSNENYSSGEANTWVRYSGIFVAPSGCESICVLLYGNRSRSTPAGYVNRWAGIMVEEQVGDGANPSPWSEGNSDLISASVSVLQEAFVDSNGNAYAGIRLVAAASGSDPAIIELVSSDGSSSVRLGGNTEIDGNLVVNGTITTDGLVANAVTQTAVDQNAATTTPTNATWTDVASFSFTSVGIGVELRGSCEVNIFTDGTTPTAQFRLVRDSTTLKTSQVYPFVDAGSGFSRVQHSIFLDHNDLPSAGTYTYKLQANLNHGTGAVVVSNRDVSNRFLSAKEFKR